MDIDDYHIILPGRIVEYFAGDQTATVTISAERTFEDTSSISGSEENITLKDVPVHTPFGGGWSLTFPIKPGDTCLLVFSQCGYDHWLFEDKDTAGRFKERSAYWLDRKFDTDDGFAFVGFNTIPKAIQDYSPIHSQWRNDVADQIITLNEDGTIDATSPIEITINAPSVIINAETTVVNSTTSTTINTPIAAVNATTSATITTPVATIAAATSCTITSAMTNIVGPLTVTGPVIVPAITVGGKGFTSHTHNENGDGGGVTGPPN